MRRLMFDTNILIDYLISSRPQHIEAVNILRLVITHDDTALLLASSLKDAYYICHRHYCDEQAARSSIIHASQVFELAALDGRTIDAALISNEPDFEDGLVRAAAETAGCAYIISRDKAAFANSNCKCLSATEAARTIYKSSKATK